MKKEEEERVTEARERERERRRRRRRREREEEVVCCLLRHELRFTFTLLEEIPLSPAAPAGWSFQEISWKCCWRSAGQCQRRISRICRITSLCRCSIIKIIKIKIIIIIIKLFQQQIKLLFEDRRPFNETYKEFQQGEEESFEAEVASAWTRLCKQLGVQVRALRQF